jgi:uncharacterized protein (DUF488 family)
MEDSIGTIWTIGHSTRTVDEFVDLLKGPALETIADVRRFPGSRRYPHFGQDQLAEILAENGIGYVHFPELGGRRRPTTSSRNNAWRNAAFRGYAEYVETPPFEEGIARLLAVACHQRTALMCAEAVWWRCHRALISDYLKIRGIKVLHIIGPGKIQEHTFTSAAQVKGTKLSYEAREAA